MWVSAKTVLYLVGGSGAAGRRHRCCRCRPLPRRLLHLWKIFVILHDAPTVADAAQRSSQQHLQGRGAGKGDASSCAHVGSTSRQYTEQARWLAFVLCMSSLLPNEHALAQPPQRE